MFTVLFIRELQNYLYSLRFQISFVIMLLVFVVGSVTSVFSQRETQEKQNKYEKNEREKLADRASNISNVAVNINTYIAFPRTSEVIADCKENYLPNRFNYSAYNVFGYSLRQDSNNMLLGRAENLSWAFIVGMFLSFITLLFTFDAVSGEKEDHTLSLVFSNPVSRPVFLLSKLAGAVTAVSLMEVVGIMVSLLILSVSGKFLIDGSFLLCTLGFVGVSVLFITTFAVFGLLSSVVTSHSNISLLISLCFWILTTVIVPNTSVFFANKLFAIPSLEKVREGLNAEKEDINKNLPDGSWYWSDRDPFDPRLKLRSEALMALMLCEKRHMDAYYEQQFDQFESTRALTLLSPVAQFDYIVEAVVEGGYFRFRKIWEGLHTFNIQFLQWFKDVDAKDAKSPHWYNPQENTTTSSQKVEVNLIPVYVERATSIKGRLQFVGSYLTMMTGMMIVLLIACFAKFASYDVR